MNTPEFDNLRVKLSNLDGNDSENVTYKVITRFLNLVVIILVCSVFQM